VRTIFRLCLVVALVAAVGVVAVPTAQAKAGAIGQVSITNFEKKQNKKIRKAKRKAKKAHERIELLKGWNLDQDGTLGEHGDLLDQIVTGALEIIAGLQALQAALEDDVAPALEAIDDALNDETTGLVGLNLARPQFGVFDDAGLFLGGTGSVASGPSDDAGHPAAGTYIVDFGNDVSDRALVFTAFPTGGAPLVGSPVNCASDTSGTCTAVLGAGDHSDQVLVIVQDSTTGAPTDGTFQIMAISG